MAEETGDIFGKIDAILGRRAGFAGKRPDLDDDFPMLTEVVEEHLPVSPAPVADAMSASSKPVEPPPSVAASAGQLTEVEIDRLAAALDARLSELFIRQQLRIETLVRRVVREELDARKDEVLPRL
ncbi:MAG: hypothetical protein P4L70_10325 [Parasulfuritortus sp.]|jgi:hypothetical protein|nr:hypothetical protein [Parasulfuritortus sp.]